MPGEATQRVVSCGRTDDHDVHPVVGVEAEGDGWCPGRPGSAIFEVPSDPEVVERLRGAYAAARAAGSGPGVPRAGGLRELTEEVRRTQAEVAARELTTPPLAMEYEFKHNGVPIRISRQEVQTIPHMGRPGRGEHRPGFSVTLARSQAVEVHLLNWDRGAGTVTGIVGTGGTIGYGEASLSGQVTAEDALKLAEVYAREVAEAILDYQAAIDAAAIAFQHRVVQARTDRGVVPVVEDRKPE